VRRDVALVAGQTGVLALQQVSSFFVVESLGVPFDQREIFAVVIGVTARAFLARSGWNVVGGVQSFMSGKASGYLCVTLQTFQCRLTAKLVTGCAIRRSV